MRRGENTGPKLGGGGPQHHGTPSSAHNARATAQHKEGWEGCSVTRCIEEEGGGGVPA